MVTWLQRLVANNRHASQKRNFTRYIYIYAYIYIYIVAPLHASHDRGPQQKPENRPDVWRQQPSVPIVAQCSVTLASVSATPPCNATPYERQLVTRYPCSWRATAATVPARGGVAQYLGEEKGTQTQTFWSGYFRLGWGSPT